MMKASLEAERNIEEGDKKALTFDEVREYLKKRTKNAGDPLIGALTLDDTKGGFRTTKKNSKPSTHISKQRELETEELQFKSSNKK